MEEVQKQTELELSDEKEMKKYESKKMKNLASVVILLFGLLMGSIFVDTVQFIKGGGFSAKNLNKADVFESGGKTWVAYLEPAVQVSVISDENCSTCDPGEALVWLRRVAPTISVKKIAFDSEEGKRVVADNGIKTIPAFIFSESITKTEFYSQAQILFDKKNGGYFLRTQELGLAPGKFLSTPEVGSSSATVGAKDAKVKLVVFSDFQCPYSKIFHKSMRDVMKQFGDKVQFSFRTLPLNFHQQAENAAMSGYCAGDQNKFWEYADQLFNRQNEWGATTGTAKFKDYAKMIGLDTTKFNKCMDQGNFKDQIEKDKQEAESFGVAGTPAVFVNDQFKNAAISSDQLKSLIDAELSK